MLCFYRILNTDDIENIRRGKARKQMCELLLDILPYRGTNAFPAFLTALRKTKQTHACELLSADDGADIKL